MKKNRRNGGKYALYLSVVPEFKAGDPPPTGYREWHEWASVQEAAGITQTKCSCRKYFYPQEADQHKDCR